MRAFTDSTRRRFTLHQFMRLPLLGAGIIFYGMGLGCSSTAHAGDQSKGTGMHKIESKDGTQVAYQRSGAGPALVLVHGSTADHTRWGLILPALEEHFTVYAMDRRGRGASGDAKPYAIQREFEDVAALIDSVGKGGKVDVLAHSFGGVCALEAALLTTNIRKLVLYEPPPLGFKESPGTIAKMREQLDADDREGLLSTFLLEVAGLTPDELEPMRSVPAWQRRVAAAHTILRELESIAAMPPFDAERFGRLATPTLLLLGGDSHVTYKETIEQIHSMLPNSRIAVMPGQKHVAMNTAPEVFVQEVLGFLLQ
jgi:pimeloyl-ACP methyl ester carboxylesterase